MTEIDDVRRQLADVVQALDRASTYLVRQDQATVARQLTNKDVELPLTDMVLRARRIARNVLGDLRDAATPGTGRVVPAVARRVAHEPGS